jgi:hypothetical protein
MANKDLKEAVDEQEGDAPPKYNPMREYPGLRKGGRGRFADEFQADLKTGEAAKAADEEDKKDVAARRAKRRKALYDNPRSPE